MVERKLRWLTPILVITGALLLAVLLGTACAPTEPEFDRIVGEGCGEAPRVAARAEGNGWRVILRETIRTERVVTDQTGVLREQTVIHCSVVTCNIVNASDLTEAQAVDRCERSRARR